MSESPDRSVVQVPDSSPAKPLSSVAKSSLKEKFAFNGYDLMKKAPSHTARDVEILKKLFPTVSDNFIKVVYQTKANNDLKAAKLMLTGVIEKRKQAEILSKAKDLHSKPQQTSNGHVKSINLSSSGPRKPIEEIEINSSPDVSPKKPSYVSSSKVVLEKTKTISERYSHNRKQTELSPEKSVEPASKKRRLVKGTRTEVRSTSPDVIDLSDEEEDRHLVDDDSDLDVDENELVSNEDYYQEQALTFFNTAEVREIIDVTGCEPNIAEKIIQKRPFNSMNHFESLSFGDKGTSSRKNKADGEVLSNRAGLVLRGYKAVESLVNQCDTYSQKISNEISKWGVKVHGVDAELEIVEVDIDDDDEDDDEDNIVGFNRKPVYIKEKPELLADNVELKNYQQVGLNWLNLLYNKKLSCILADEMGLGKTCQVIAFFAFLKQKGNNGPHLVVVPSSTLENWLREFNKFAPSLVIEPYYGSLAEREEMREVLSEKMNEIDVIVTTYNLTTSSKDDFRFLKNVGFNVVVYDEGHMLKNSMSERFQKLMRIRSKFRLLLTGTPLQNNLKELMSLLEFILPSIFVSKKEDLKYVFSQRAKTDDNAKGYNPLLSQRAIANAKKMMAPFILRRKKSQVLKHLPAKHSSIAVCDLNETQELLYKEQVKFGKDIKEKRINGTAPSNSGLNSVLMNLRKAAIHPMLFRSLYTDKLLRKMARDIMKEPIYQDANQEFIFEDMQVMNDFELHNLCLKFPTVDKYKLSEDEFLKSGKVIKLKELLDNIITVQNGKVLIFSLFTQVLDILEHVLSKWSIKFLRLDGSTSVDIRQDLIDTFYQDDSIPVFLLSTKAGGFGINLVCANNVIIFDQSFNPHDDKQAEDRAHRVGQEKEVFVTRIISKGTIEENMYVLAKNKLELDQSMSGEQIEKNAASAIDDMIFSENPVKVGLDENIENSKEKDLESSNESEDSDQSEDDNTSGDSPITID